MKTLQLIASLTVATSAIKLAAPQALGQQGDANKIAEQEKKALQDQVEAQKAKVRQTLAVSNARQIGLALFEFETEYNSFPDEKTAAAVKNVTKTSAEVKAVTANDCFFQLIAANILATDSVLSIEPAPAANTPADRKVVDKVTKCSFAYISGVAVSGNSRSPLVVAPLVKGKTTFDPTVLGGKAVVLLVDNSVRTYPIEADGRVLIDGKDMFDPAQPFWNDKAPTLKWPEP